MSHSADITVLADGLAFPEGPLVLPDGTVWCVELHGGNLLRVGVDGPQRFATGGRPNGLCADDQARIWICDAGANAIRRFDPASQVFVTVCEEADGAPLTAPNDCCFDDQGNLLFTCPGDSRVEPTGFVCCLDPAGLCRVIIDGWNFPNGLGFTADGRLLVAETYRQRLRIGRWDGRSWQEDGIFAVTGGDPGPDGFCLLPDGGLAVAVFGAGRIALLAADGSAKDSIPLPGRRPTNCCLAEDGSLLVTEAERGQLLRVPLP